MAPPNRGHHKQIMVSRIVSTEHNKQATWSIEHKLGKPKANSNFGEFGCEEDKSLLFRTSDCGQKEGESDHYIRFPRFAVVVVVTMIQHSRDGQSHRFPSMPMAQLNCNVENNTIGKRTLNNDNLCPFPLPPPDRIELDSGHLASAWTTNLSLVMRS